MIKSFIALTKPKLTSLSVFSAIVGYGLGLNSDFSWKHFLTALLGILLVGGGSNAFNMFIERVHDSNMLRTRLRPLPQQKLTPYQALAWALTLSATGLYVLSALVNPLAGWLGLLTLITYVLVYTPLKRVTSLCTVAGAIPGAIPPLIGYAAAAGNLGYGVIFLAMILFIWQMPHFLAISWIYRKDYHQAGFPMLSVLDDDGGRMTGRQIAVYSMALLPTSLAPAVLGFSGSLYFGGALVLGLGFLGLGLSTLNGCGESKAQLIFRYSIVYLPILMTLFLIDYRLFS